MNNVVLFFHTGIYAIYLQLKKTHWQAVNLQFFKALERQMFHLNWC